MNVWGMSDPGMVRPENQDAFSVRELPGDGILAVVCDGMGGAKAGNIASAMALDVFQGEVRRGMKPNMKTSQIETLLRSGVELANKAVFEQAQSDEEYRGMGTTLVAAIILRGVCYIIHVGDSRAYHMNEEGISCVTKDHSFVQEMVERGDLTQEQAKAHPRKNLITRAIGTEPSVEGDFYRVEFQPDDCLVLCSDGLSNVVSDQEILFEVIHGEEKTDCCQRLVEIAKHRGAPDNVTAVLVAG